MDTPQEPRRRRATPPNPMEEENFPTRSPTRDAVEREMREPSNVRGPSPVPRRGPPLKEAGGEEEEDGAPAGRNA